jgi:tRNA nucleotidyltransferase (CCA-adding enzyme)
MDDFRASLPASLADPLRALAREIRAAGGRALLVGGAVRDLLLGSVPTELDAEVFGLDFEAIERALRGHFATVRVGRSFPVLKLREHPIDVAVPRVEWATGPRHTDFAYRAGPELDFATAARRRDFTVNAISWDPLTGTIIDPVGGRNDLADGILRKVSDQFGEDVLRVLRAMQFAARFDFVVEEDTVATCRSLTPHHLARERVFEEWRKLFLRGQRPSRGLFFLEEAGWLRFYPELEATVDTPQDARWHPEGNVWPHTLYALDAFAEERIGDPTEDLVVGLAVLCHDLGKPACTIHAKGAIRSPGHEKAGIEPTRRFLDRLTAESFWFDQVEPLVATHMRPRQLYEQRSGPSAIRRLADRVGRIDRLLRVCRADAGGRPPLPRGDFAEGEWLRGEARKLCVEDQRPETLVRGRDLLDLGLDPGPPVGRLLRQLFEEQLEGIFSTREEGIARARALLGKE